MPLVWVQSDWDDCHGGAEKGSPRPRSRAQFHDLGRSALSNHFSSHLTHALPDDPYYFLYYGDAPRSPSYFSLELEQPEVGRVLRFDSLSKVLSSGIRIGFLSGPEPLLQAIDMHVSTMR